MICIGKTKCASEKGLLYPCHAQVTGNSAGFGVSKAKSVEGKHETEIDLGAVAGEGRVVQTKRSSTRRI